MLTTPSHPVGPASISNPLMIIPVGTPSNLAPPPSKAPFLYNASYAGLDLLNFHQDLQVHRMIGKVLTEQFGVCQTNLFLDN